MFLLCLDQCLVKKEKEKLNFNNDAHKKNYNYGYMVGLKARSNDRVNIKIHKFLYNEKSHTMTIIHIKGF